MLAGVRAAVSLVVGAVGVVSVAALVLFGIAVAGAGGEPAAAAGTGVTLKTARIGGVTVLTDAKGMSLYTFDKDADGKSACNGPCAANWPALKAEAGDAASDGYTIVTRDDGSRQWAHKGKPLYTFAKDTKPGDITGDGFLNGAWHLAQP